MIKRLVERVAVHCLYTLISIYTCAFVSTIIARIRKMNGLQIV